MRKKMLIKAGEDIYRVLDVEEDNVLLIDCLRQTMPKWWSLKEVGTYEECSEEEFLQVIDMTLPDLTEVENALRSTAYQRFNIVAEILPFLSDDRMRVQKVKEAAEQSGLCRQTVRNYLCSYLVFQSISVLIPQARDRYNKPLTKDEKNIRWAINKFYYTTQKNSLMDAFSFMLKAKYCDEQGILLEEHPSFNQFRYFYSKYKKMQSVYISREGSKKYQRDYRPLLGDRIKDYASHIGVGEIDSTICDIHLVDDYGNYLGRPILTILSDSFSNGYVLGYSLTLEGGTYSLRNLLLNCLTDKVEWCRKFGIFIEQHEWDYAGVLPGTIVSDMGGEYKSETFSQITELGITLINLPPLRPELKSIVERSFQLLQTSMKPALFQYGYVDKDYGKRLAKDSRKNAVLTLREYEKCVIYAILYNNNNRILEDYPYTEEMLQAEVSPHPSDIFCWGRKQEDAVLVPTDKRQMILTLLPRVHTNFSRRGLLVLGLRYDCQDRKYTEEYLTGEEAVVAYNPEDVDTVYLIQDGEYVEFKLIESRFSGMTFEKVREMLGAQKELVKKAVHENLQGRIDLNTNIETIVMDKTKHQDVNLKNVRATRKRERKTNHLDFIKEIDI